MRNNKELLIAGGVRFYGPDYLRFRERTLEKMFGIHERARELNRRTPEEQLQFLAKGGHHVVFSEENFIGPLHDGKGNVSLPLYAEAGHRLSAFRERLPNVPLRLFFAIRRPHAFLQSAYSQALLSGVYLSPDSFRRRNPIEEVDWVELLDRINETPDHEGLYVWQYEAYQLLLRPLTRPMMGWGFARKIKVTNDRVHQGLSAAALDQLLEWNAAGRKGDIAAQARKKYPVSEAYPKFRLFSKEVSAAAGAWYETQIEEIRSKKGSSLLSFRRACVNKWRARLEKRALVSYLASDT